MNRLRYSARLQWGLAALLILAVATAPGQTVKLPDKTRDVADVLRQAELDFANGKESNAVALITQAIASDPKNPNAYARRGVCYEKMRQHTNAIADFDASLRLDPKATGVYQHRGTEHFRLGQFKEAIADFDKFIERAPAQDPHHWQRGIAYYYAGRFEDGRRQFERHQTVNPNDVENAAWHYLCVARLSGVEKARASLLPIKEDTRVPMMQVLALFAGQARPEDVLAVAQAGNPPPKQRDEQLFYAHLYLGLYYEASGDTAKARKHILTAAHDFKADHYMGDVARVHARILEKQKE